MLLTVRPKTVTGKRKKTQAMANLFVMHINATRKTIAKPFVLDTIIKS